MIIVPGKLIYLFTPKTGSRATERAFLEHVPEALISNAHHDHPDMIPNLGIPVYATIRNPYDQVLSWYWGPWRRSHTIEEFLRRSPPSRNWIQKRLNCYDEYVDGYFLYEDGLEQIFRTLGYGNVRIDRVGVSGADKSLLTEDVCLLIDELLPYDVALYQRVLEAYRRMNP